MSIGAIVPISTCDLLLRSEDFARSSDCCATFSAATAAFRFQYAYFTLRIVTRIVCRSEMSVISRFIFVTINCSRALSIERFRINGCVKLKFRFDASDGFGLSYALLDLLRDESIVTV